MKRNEYATHNDKLYHGKSNKYKSMVNNLNILNSLSNKANNDAVHSDNSISPSASVASLRVTSKSKIKPKDKMSHKNSLSERKHNQSFTSGYKNLRGDYNSSPVG